MENREIKFRAWDKRTGEWYQDGNGFAIAWDATAIIDDNQHEESTKGAIVFSQFTGLKDRLGVDIYEGDILKLDCDCEDFVCNCYDKVIFERGAFMCGGDLLGDYFDVHLIVGNIYQNADMLPDDKTNFSTTVSANKA